MKRAILLAAAILAAASLRAQDIDLDKEFFHLPDSVTDSYLDSLTLSKRAKINDYWIVGVHGGVSIEHGFFNPPRVVNFYLNKPVYGFSITRYATMMNMFQNLGMELGFQHNYEGYNFKEHEMEGGGTYRQNIDGAYEAYMEVPEVFMLTHGHFDVGQHFKMMMKAGIYGGYRMNITRIGPWVYDDEFKFKDTDRRWSYGVQGGLGFGFMVDPFEFHLMAQIKWSWSSFYQPDVASPYYYRFAFPLDAAVTFGVYYQLTPRRGHTRSQLRQMAKKMVADAEKEQQR